MEEEEREHDVRTPASSDHVARIAFAESLKEWAELPADGPEATAWAAALAHEMTVGFWRGAVVQVVSSDNRLDRVLIEERISASLWRNRTPDLSARARSLAATLDPDE